MPLALTDGQKLVQTGLDVAQSRQLQVSIAVVDAAGYLISAARMDRAPLLSPEIAQGKAAAAALFRRPTGELAQRWAAGSGIPQAMAVRLGGRFVAVQGAIPLREGDQVIGAVGVSGATSQEDEEIAQAAIEAL